MTELDLTTGTRVTHKKGGKYVIFNVGTHSETKERLVVYANSKGEVWIRPLAMFLDAGRFTLDEEDQ